MRNTFIKTLTDLADKDESIYAISGDAGFGVFDDFQREKPDQFINAGIAEANTIGYAAGLALTGFNVFYYNIVPFVLYRCFEQVRNDICYQRLPVTLIGIGSGVTYAPGGMTHYSVEDLAICQALPNMTVISPIDPVETAAAVIYAANADHPVYIRIAKAGEPAIREDGCPDITTPAVIRDGKDVAILSYGSICYEAIRAVDELRKDGIKPRLISVPMLQPFPGNILMNLLSDCHTVVVVEEHFRSGGLTSRMADLLVEQYEKKKLIPCTLPDRFIHNINDSNGIRKMYNIDYLAIVEKIKNIF